MPDVPLAAQPRIVRALARMTLVVGATGVVCASFGSLGGVVISSAARAAVSAGDGFSGGGGSSDVSTMAFSSPVELGQVDAVVASIAGTDVVPGPVTVIPNEVVQAAVVAVEPVAAPVAAVVAPVAQPAAEVVAPPTVEAPAIRPPETVPAVPEESTAVRASQPLTVEEIIREVFGPHAESAIRVARCESGLNPAAISKGGGNWGLFQINTAHRSRVARMGFQWEDLLDPAVNSIVAKAIFDEQGWRPWGCRRAA